ncbi:MAG: hypothetical protein ACYC9O_02945 [Candidatus Latescibacterota bacterium]
MKEFIQSMVENIGTQIDGRRQVIEHHRAEIERRTQEIHSLEHDLIALTNRQMMCDAILSYMKEKDHADQSSGSDPDQADIRYSDTPLDRDTLGSQCVPSGSADQ